jgi:membrane protease YdiL (CAAX protease family)
MLFFLLSIQYIDWRPIPLSTDYNPLTPGALEPQVLPPPPARVPVENPPWSIWEVVSIALITFGAISICGLIGGLVAIRVYHLTPADLERNAKLAVPVELVAYFVTLAFMIFLVRSRKLPFWHTVGWRWTGRILPYLALGFLLAFTIGFLSDHLPIPRQLPIEQYFADTAAAWMIAIFGVTIAPLMEELFFRGFLYPAIARPLGMYWSILITSAAFALIHSPQLATAWVPLLLILIVGIVLTILRARTRSVVPGFIVHVAYNFTLFAVFYQQTNHFHNFGKVGG